MKSEVKRIVITGGAGGIGSQLCESFIKAGHHVTVLENSREAFDRLHKNLDKSPMLEYKQTDVSDPASVKKVSEDVREVDVLINAAAVLWPVAPFLETDLEKIHQSIQISLLGTVNSCFYFLPALQRAAQGKIINFSGGGGGDARADHMAYSLSKTAVVRLSENLSVEYPAIDVNSIAPGAHKTTMWKDEASDPEPDKWGSMSDLVDFFAWLISEKSNGITGRFINVKDDWRSEEFLAKAKADPNFLTLRRIDDFRFTKTS